MSIARADRGRQRPQFRRAENDAPKAAFYLLYSVYTEQRDKGFIFYIYTAVHSIKS